MREIKFRCWDTVDANDPAMIRWEDLRDTQLLEYGFDGEKTAILMQYTGLKDKNGREIYESDIVMFTTINHDTYKAVVEWDDVNPSFMLRRQPERFGEDVEFDFVQCGHATLEVIGNIYENKSCTKSECKWRAGWQVNIDHRGR